MRVQGIPFCERYGEEARIGAGLEAYTDANYFFERFCNPHVPSLGPGIESGLDAALESVAARASFALEDSPIFERLS